MDDSPDLLERERLVQVRSADALQKCADLRAQRIAGQEDEPPKKLRVIPSQSLVETRPVELRHLEVDQDEVVRLGAQSLQGDAAVGRDVHAMVVEPEKIRQHIG